MEKQKTHSLIGEEVLEIADKAPTIWDVVTLGYITG